MVEEDEKARSPGLTLKDTSVVSEHSLRILQSKTDKIGYEFDQIQS